MIKSLTLILTLFTAIPQFFAYAEGPNKGGRTIDHHEIESLPLPPWARNSDGSIQFDIIKELDALSLTGLQSSYKLLALIPVHQSFDGLISIPKDHSFEEAFSTVVSKPSKWTKRQRKDSEYVHRYLQEVMVTSYFTNLANHTLLDYRNPQNHHIVAVEYVNRLFPDFYTSLRFSQKRNHQSSLRNLIQLDQKFELNHETKVKMEQAIEELFFFELPALRILIRSSFLISRNMTVDGLDYHKKAISKSLENSFTRISSLLNILLDQKSFPGQQERVQAGDVYFSSIAEFLLSNLREEERVFFKNRIENRLQAITGFNGQSRKNLLSYMAQNMNKFQLIGTPLLAGSFLYQPENPLNLAFTLGLFYQLYDQSKDTYKNISIEIPFLQTVSSLSCPDALQ